jgi:hypothetical protein
MNYSIRGVALAFACLGYLPPPRWHPNSCRSVSLSRRTCFRMVSDNSELYSAPSETTYSASIGFRLGLAIHDL